MSSFFTSCITVSKEDKTAPLVNDCFGCLFQFLKTLDSIFAYGRWDPAHFSTNNLLSPKAKLTLTKIVSPPLNGNMLSSAKSLGK